MCHVQISPWGAVEGPSTYGPKDNWLRAVHANGGLRYLNYSAFHYYGKHRGGGAHNAFLRFVDQSRQLGLPMFDTELHALQAYETDYSYEIDTVEVSEAPLFICSLHLAKLTLLAVS